MLMTLFLVLQACVIALLVGHDWIHFPPFTNIHALEKHHSWKERLIITVLNTVPALLAFLLTIKYMPIIPLWAQLLIVICYSALTIGTIASWWIPYFFGSTAAHKKGFEYYAHTHHFLPARKDHVVPNTVHVVMHVLIWICTAMAWYFLIV